MHSNEETDSRMVKNQLEAEKNNLGMLLRIWKDDKVHVEEENAVGNMNFMKRYLAKQRGTNRCHAVLGDNVILND